MLGSVLDLQQWSGLCMLHRPLELPGLGECWLQ